MPNLKEIFGLQVPNSLPEVCRRERMALLVYDMQVGIASQIKDADSIVAKAGQVLKAARGAGVRTFFTRHMSLPLELMGAFQFRMAMKWQRVDEPGLVKPAFLRDSPGFHIVPSLTPRASEAVLDKITMSAFEGTPLAMSLRDCAVSAIAIVGIALEVGIEPTARHASDLGLIPVIIADACGSGDAEAAKRSLESLAFEGNTMITDVAAFIDALARSINDGRH
jgi:nicotinamidase-related amidase